MEAPVPASALIHSATLVSAGVFLILRFFSLFEQSIFALTILSFLGAVTSFIGGFISMHQSDTKKILAFSTISHCGFLIFLASFGILEYTIFYLYVHGFFKALVFMSIGNINRFNKNCQDFKKMGIFYKYLPFDMFICFIGLLNLSGIPFSIGFYVKHLIFICLQSNTFLACFIFVNLLFGAATGIFYCSRIFFYVFFDFKKNIKNVYNFTNFNLLTFKFFSHTTVASHLSLIILFFISYIISIWLYYILIADIFVFSDSFKFKEMSSTFLNFYLTQNYLYNFFFSNIFIFFFIFFIFTQK